MYVQWFLLFQLQLHLFTVSRHPVQDRGNTPAAAFRTFSHHQILRLALESFIEFFQSLEPFGNAAVLTKSQQCSITKPLCANSSNKQRHDRSTIKGRYIGMLHGLCVPLDI